MKIAYLGPAGTFTEDALREALRRRATSSPCGRPTVHDAILAVERGEADRALVPFENSIEGSVRTTLDTLAFDAGEVTIVGEHDFAVRAHLIAAGPIELGEIEAVLSHPQPLAQCARFLRERLPGAERHQRDQHRRGGAPGLRAERVPARRGGDRRPLGGGALPGGKILAEGIEDEANNVTRFVWIAPAGTEPEGAGEWKTSLVFSELGEDHPGALVDALREFSSRGVNLTRIESRPLRQGLGRYMFFCDLEGATRRRAGRRGDRGAPQARPNRSGSWAPTRSADPVRPIAPA